MRGIKTETCEENPDDPDRKKFVSRLSPRLRHDCVISNDVEAGLEKEYGIVSKSFIQRNGDVR